MLMERKHAKLPPLPPFRGGNSLFFSDDETSYDFTPIPANAVEDQKVFDASERDGLKLGEWLTVPDLRGLALSQAVSMPTRV